MPESRGRRHWGAGRALLDDAEARDRLLDAAEKCIVRRGDTQIRMSEVADAAAVGDTYNDIPMLEAVGHSFIVANAEKHMEAHARFRVPSNNDRGVAALIDAILATKQ